MTNPSEIYTDAPVTIGQNDALAAIATLEEELVQHPDKASAHVELGALHHQQGNADAALEHYKEAALLDPGNIKYLKMLADYYYVELQEVESAIETNKKILQIDPNDVDTLTVTGNLCLCEHLWQDAEHYYQRVIDIEPWRFEIQEYLDKLASRNDATGSQRGDDAKGLYESGMEMVERGALHEAAEQLQRAIDIDPDLAVAYNDLGVISYQIGEKSSAFEYYRMAVEKMPSNHAFLKNLADFYCYENGDLEEALPIYSKILNENPADTDVLFTMGVVNAQLGRPNDAQMFFHRVLDIEPWNAEASEQLDKMGVKDSILI